MGSGQPASARDTSVFCLESGGVPMSPRDAGVGSWEACTPWGWGGCPKSDQEGVFQRLQGWELEPGSAGRWAPGGPCLVAEVRR